MSTFNCIIIDDEPLACKGLKEYIDEIPSLNIVGVAYNPAEAIRYIHNVDLMYLDINMPKISGIDFLQQVKNPPLTIITSAYGQYALQGYELNVADYLLKPISFPRFLKATTKAIDYLKLAKAVKSADEIERNDYFFVKSNGVLEKISVTDITAIEALANYIIIHCNDRKIIAYLTMKQIKDYLPSSLFIQVHKSFIVSCNKIKKIDHDEIILDNLKVPIGLNFKITVQEQIINGNVLKR
jgi:DNA-binding LytR/AlgR family response regulator